MNIIDFHSHVLPYADHGSDSEETTLKQLQLARSAGVDVIVATSHFYPHKHNVKSFIERREHGFEKLIKVRDATGLNIKVIKGAEVLICQGLEHLPDLDMLCVENTKTLLLELPLYEFRSGYAETVEALIDTGYTVVLAHADRYDPEDVELLISSGVKIQLNADSLSAFLIKKYIKGWISRNLVVAIGSDIHMADAVAYKKFSKALKKLGGKAGKIMSETEKLIY